MKTTHFNGRALRLAVATVLAAGCGAFGVNSHAGTDWANLSATASISAHCVISTVPADSGAVTSTCTDGSAAAVIVDQKAGAADSASAPAVTSSMPESQNQPAGAVITTVMY